LPQVLSSRERYLVLTLWLVALVSLIYLPFSVYRHNTGPVADYGGSYTEGLLGEPKYINPLLAQSSDTDRDLSEIIYRGLMQYDGEGNLKPDLAESYEVSSDGLEYTFTLRPNLLWQDGKPINADDVLFTIRLLQNSDYSTSQRINWQGVESERVSALKVKFKLKNRYAQFLNNSTLGILPKHIWEGINPNNFAIADLNLKPIGSGPYRFKKLEKDDTGQIISYELESFPEYYAGRPYIDTLVFRFYHNEDELVTAFNHGEIDGISFLSSDKIRALRFSSKLNIQSIRLPRYFAAFFNPNQSQTLNDKNVRLALNYATDKKTLVDEIFSGQATIINSPLLAELRVPETPPKYSYDESFAVQILNNSGWKDTNNDGFREKKDSELVLKVKTSNWPELARAAELIKKQWEKIGVKVELDEESATDIKQSIKDRSYDVLIFGEILNLDPDQYSYWHSSQKKDPGLNLALYDNKNVDKIIEETRQILNPLERAKRYEDFEKLILEDAPAVFLYSPYYIYLPSKDIKGDNLSVLSIPSTRFDNISQWYINTKRVKPKQN